MEEQRVFTIHKGLSRSVEFRGLQGQYVVYMAVIVVGDLVAFVLLQLVLNGYLCVCLVFGLGGWLVRWLYRMNNRYGRYGLMKSRARKGVPEALVSRSRIFFIQLQKDETAGV